MDYEDLLQAYYDCRRTKRNTANALAFELDYESKLLGLLEEINNHRWMPGRSVTFTVVKPVLREIFASGFRDRVVHHAVINKLNPYFEKWFIYDSYACRKGRGVLFGVRRVERFIRSCSRGHTRDCYVLKLDVAGFFMNIDKKILWQKLSWFIREHYDGKDKSYMLELCFKIIWHDPTTNYLMRGHKSDWDGLPRSKSLFGTPSDKGIPIGNLTSQVFANFYMGFLDHYIKHDLGIRYYGRYVDDFVLVHEDKDVLRELIPKIRDFLKDELDLELHPKKLYMQHYKHGLPFLGTFILPGRTYAHKRLKGAFYDAIARHNKVARDHKPTDEEVDAFLSTMNSYLGILRHHKTFNMRKKMLYKHLSTYWWNHVKLDRDATVFKKRKRRVKQPPYEYTPNYRRTKKKDDDDPHKFDNTYKIWDMLLKNTPPSPDAELQQLETEPSN